MSSAKKNMERATREGRVALLPPTLQVGSEVWYWRESLCDEDGCLDMASSCCPLNHGIPWFEDEARECARQHPILEHATVWSACSYFTPRGVEWSINGLPAVSDCHLRNTFFASREEAVKNRPGRVV